MTDPSNQQQVGNDVHKEVTGETLDPGQTEVNEPVRPELDEEVGSQDDGRDPEPVPDGVEPDDPEDNPEDAPSAPDPEQADG